MNYILKYIAFFCCVGFLDATKFRCDYKNYDNGWYKYNETPMTWNDARFYCHLQGAALASPTTTDISGAMIELINKDSVFTGIHSTFTKGQFYSLDGIPLSSIPHTWAESEPDNKNDNERCIALNTDGEMSDVNCSEQRPFICHRRNSNTQVNICGTLDPDYHFESRTNKCYKLHTVGRNFNDASFVCSAEGGHLAIVNNDEESRVIRDLFGRYPSKNISGNFWKEHAFIGFYNWKETAEWTTIHGQSIQDAGFATWSPGEPNSAHGGETCGSVNRNGLLNDLRCDYIHVSICEKDPNFPPLCDSFDNSIYHNSLNVLENRLKMRIK